MVPSPQLLATAVEVVVRAGDLQMAQLGRQVRVDKKGAIDLVTEVDIAVERMARRVLAERFPDHRVLAEELDEPEGRPASSYCWVFDPLDGTTNYAHGLPIFCASLALEVDGEATVGAVYDPTRRELFTAERGVGAWLNGARLRVSDATALIDALLCTGFPYDVHESADEVVGLFSRFLGQARAVRRLGSAAMDLCYVAAGRFDGFWEQRLHPWDTAAAALVVKEAGGRVTTFEGGPFQSRAPTLVATNGRIHEAMIRTIGDFTASAERSRNRTG